MYSNSAINLPNKRFTSTELDKALDDIIKGRIKLNASVNGPNFLATSDKKPKLRKNNYEPSKPILDDILELPDAPSTQSASSIFSTSGWRPWQQTNNPRLGQSSKPIRGDALELPEAPSTQSASSIFPTSGWRPWQQTNNPRSGQLIRDDVLELPDAPSAVPAGQGPWPPAPAYERPALWAPNDRTTQSLPFGHGSIMTDAYPASESIPHERYNQPRVPVPTGPRSDGRPAASFSPSSPHGKSKQPEIPVATGPRSNMDPITNNPLAFPHARKNQAVVPATREPRSEVQPASNLIPASASQSSPASPYGKANKPGMAVPTEPRSNSRPEGAPSTRNAQCHPAQSFAQVPSAQASQQAPQSSPSSSPSIQRPDSTQARRSGRDFKLIRMRIVENAVTVRSGYAFFWD